MVCINMHPHNGRLDSNQSGAEVGQAGVGNIPPPESYQFTLVPSDILYNYPGKSEKIKNEI